MEAGCRHADRVHAYLDNLHRLGLIWFSREPVERRRAATRCWRPSLRWPKRCEQGGRTARTVRRSILLTPFGEDFCATCLPLDGRPGLGPPTARSSARSRRA